ncbi:hypothetical protein I7X12_03850 [Halosimplex litoreum]|uniref:Uncharacterized protein n=1 Tax=Halosimplex litoreum TaxID=1198301 RepID=A0A7T3G013_9EURY|nr:hypothetical protein [Halosimplex litoreum]QPV63776.1 hypothetical protein I7X12_03850 [Halosimplex litoreum]
MDGSITRRNILKLLGGGGVLGFGFLYFGTRPRVVEHEAEGELSGETEFFVRVANAGVEGTVRVSVEIMDSNNDAIKRSSTVVTLPRNPTIQVRLSVAVPANADTYSVSATATNFPGNVFS